jgi:hypothetical protein
MGGKYIGLWSHQSQESIKACWILGRFNKRLNRGNIDSNILSQKRYMVDKILHIKK